MAILGRPPSESDLLKLIEAGVVDHLVKPLGSTLTCAKIRAVAERSRTQRELKNKLKFALEFSAHDALTGLYNRRYFERRLREESAHAKRHKRPYSLILVDLDHFKLVNDTYGHEDGDRVLCHVAELILGALREDDVWVRVDDLPDLAGGAAMRVTAPGPVEREIVTWYRVGDVVTHGVSPSRCS